MGQSKSRKIILPAAHCVGEKIESLRSLIKRQTEIGGTGYVDTTSITLNPYLVPCSAWTGSGYNYNPLVTDSYSQILPLFGLVKGGMRFKVITRYPVDNTCQVSVVRRAISDSADKVISYTNDTYAVSLMGTRLSTYTKLTLNDCVDFEVPYYSKTQASPVGALFVCPAFYSFYVENVPTYSVYIRANTTIGSTAPTVLRGGADDLSCGVFISTVPVLNWSKTD